MLDGFKKIFNELYPLNEQLLSEWKKTGGASKDGSRAIKIKSADFVFNSANWIITSPDNFSSMETFGIDTAWTAAERESVFDDYLKDGPIYVIINKNDYGQRYLLHLGGGEFIDFDGSITVLADFLEDNKELIEPLEEIALQRLLRLLNTTATSSIKLNINVDELAEDLLDKKDIDRDAISGEDAIKLIKYEGDFWDSYDYYESIDVDGNCFQYDADDIMKELRANESTYNKSLAEYNITIDDVERVIHETSWNEEEHSEIENAIRTTMALGLAQGRQSGAEFEAHNDAVEAFRNATGADNFKLEYDMVELEYELATVKKLIGNIEFGLDNDYGNYYDNEYLDIYFEKMISLKIANDFKLYEPYYGWTGFDASAAVDYFIDFLPDNI